MSEATEAKPFNIKETLTLGSAILFGLFFLLLGVADLLYANDASLKFYYYGRGIATLLFGLAIILYPFRNISGVKLGAIALTVLASYFITMTYLYDLFKNPTANYIDYILFSLLIRLYIPMIIKIEDEFYRTVIDIILGGILLFYLVGILVIPFTASLIGAASPLTLGGLVNTFVIFNSINVNLTFLLLPDNILLILLRIRFIGGFIGLLLATRNKEISITRIKTLKHIIKYIFLATLFIILTFAAYNIKLNLRDNTRAKVAFISYVLYDLAFFIRVTYELAEGLYKRCE